MLGALARRFPTSSHVALSRATLGTRAYSGKIHELRQYALHTDDVPKYLELTGSDAFKARTDASPLLGFFLVETGGVLNRVAHIWEYDDLDHRTAVRMKLAKDQGFLKYFSTIRPWLHQQTSVLIRPNSFDATNGGSGSGGFFCLQSSTGAAAPAADGVAHVGSWTEVLGENGRQWDLYSAPTYQKLLESKAVTAPGTSSDLMAPTAFSPMK